MEPVGLAVGVVGLAGLFSSCLEAVEKVDSYKNFGRDSRSLATQFDTDKHRFEQWGRAVGFKKGKLSDSHHPALDDAQTLAIVHKLLASIQDFCSGADDTFYQQTTPADGNFLKDSLVPARQASLHHGAPMASKWRKAAWALSGKTKRTGHVQTFAGLVQYLYNAVPPDDEKGTLPGYGARNYDSAHPHDLRAWLGCPSPNDLYDDSIQKRLNGTCEWILKRDDVRDWLAPNVSTDASSVLWINGPAGFGKTILCARLVEILSSSIQTPVAHFFLSSKFEGRDDPFLALRSWIAEVIFGNQAALDIVCKRRLAQHEQIATRSTIVRLFREVNQTVPFCTFVLDGLDECTWLGDNRNSSDSVTRFLNDLRQAIANTTARILVVSRSESEIRQGLSLFPGFIEYTISPEDVHTDNITYSRSIVNNKLPNKEEMTRLSLSQRMADRCNGQFQWLKMQEEVLRKGRNKKQLEKDIDETPAGLDRLYDRNWERIEKLRHEERTRAVSLLRWAAFALRPLTVCEITEAVLINDDCDDLPLDEMPDSVDDDYIESEILGLCGSLIEVQDSLPESTAGSRKVHLAHFSVKQYLFFKIPSRGAVLFANLNLHASKEAIENTALAKLCLRYISFPRVWDDSITKGKDGLGSSFRDYAAGSWFQHVDISHAKDNTLVDNMNAFFDGHVQTWGSWRQWFDNNETVVPASRLYYASRLGLTGVVRHLLQYCKHDPNENSKSGRSALEVACERGYLEVAQMLLGVGTSVNVTGYGGRTPLYTASMNGNLEVVKLVLDNGADVTITNQYGWTPLNAASDGGHVKVVKLLLSKGAEIAIADEGGWTPVNSAATSGHLEVVKLLLDKGADITTSNNHGWTPVNSAAKSGHVEVVKLLLSKGAEIAIADKDGWTPLNSAARNGHLEIFKLLLDKGADITTSDNEGCTPLNSAAENGHLEVVKLLVDKGADIITGNKNGSTPLFLAAYHGHLEVVKLLLDNGADTKTTTKNGWTPLNAASDGGHLEVVKLLLARGADIAVANKDGCSPLYSAACQGHPEIVKLLLAKGADATFAENKGWTPVHIASLKGYLKLAEVLLEKCQDCVDVQETVGRTALFFAAMRGHSELVRLLVSKKASVNSKDHYNVTPLIAASRNGHESTVKLLLQAENVCIDWKDDRGLTALSWARKSGKIQTIQLLLPKSSVIEIQPSSEDPITGKEVVSYDVDPDWCDVCTAHIPDGKTYYRCEVCYRGDGFAICLECHDVGVKCLDDSHKWLLKEAD
ncbi:ankyrin repeat domain-containing protein 52 [Colletotrichum incanum]|nr:ankyrin repeat domain-containing protein 52 [Colletotrichum incanum]